MHRSSHKVAPGLALAACLLLAGCGDSTPAHVPTSLLLSPGSVSLDAIGAAVAVTATVMDQQDQPMTDVPVTWSSSSGSVAVSPAGMSAGLTAVSNGTAVITATAGGATSTLIVQVSQVPVAPVKVAGDAQAGIVGSILTTPLQVRVQDRLGGPMPGRVVTFSVTKGGGSVVPATGISDAAGLATASWTLGTTPTLSAEVTVTVAGAPAPALFVATAVVGPPAVVGIQAGNNQTALAETSVAPSPAVRVTDALGNPVPGVAVVFSVTQGGGTVTGATTTTNASGVATVGSWTLGPIPGANTLRATVTGSGISGNPVLFTATGLTNASGFNITLRNLTSLSVAQQAAFDNAAARWRTVITSDLPDVSANTSAGSCGSGSPALSEMVDDLLIFVTVGTIDGPGGTLGASGFCFTRAGGGLPAIGQMRFDVADLNNLEANGTLGAVILHEMAHVIGVGTLWTAFNLVLFPSPVGGPPQDTHYNGAGGIAGFNAIGGNTYTGGFKVPVENTSQAGTINSHWRESVLANELMTGFINSSMLNPLSLLTARSLQDVGYTVNTGAVDSFFLTLSVRAQQDAAASGGGLIPLGDDIIVSPVYSIDDAGRIERIR